MYGGHTLGVDFKFKHVGLRGETLKLMLWDSSGRELSWQPGGRTSAYYRGAQGIFVMFDVGDRTTFATASMLLGEVQRHACPECCVLLVGLKADDLGGGAASSVPPAGARAPESVREVSAAEGEGAAAAAATPSGGPVRYTECSARTGEGVERAVYYLAGDVARARKEAASKGAPLPGVLRPPEPSSRPHCCVQ